MATSGGLPTSTTIYRLTQAILDETWQMLRGPGEEQLEAVVLWLGQVHQSDRAEVLAPLFPPQVAYRSLDGLAVEIPQDVLTELIGALPAGVQILARVHSHPTEAYHSPLDDCNMVIGHEGAISIVVPRFATGPARLCDCSINQLKRDGDWRELPEREVRSRFELR